MASEGAQQQHRTFQDHLNKTAQLHEEITLEDQGEEGAPSKHLRMLAFRNPGRFMEDFDPERSTREMRKMNRRIYSESRKNQVYDEAGLIMVDGRDICDCLERDCVGCHYPCSKCASTKCGGECRINRRWLYHELEIEGTNQKVLFPDLPLPYS